MRFAVALALGLGLGLFVSAFTHYNDHVVENTFFTGNLLPPVVYGAFVLALLALNPLLGRFGKRWTLSSRQLVVMTAVGLAASSYPGSSCFRFFVGATAMPGQMIQQDQSWQAASVMSYVAGGSAALAEGQVSDWHALATGLADALDASADTLRGRWARLLDDAARDRAVRAGQMTPRSFAIELRATFQQDLNRVIELEAETTRGRRFDQVLAGVDLPAELDAGVRDADARQRLASQAADAVVGEGDARLLQEQRADWTRWRADRAESRLYRRALELAWPDLVKGMPAGQGVLLGGGEPAPTVLDPVVHGWGGTDRVGPTQVPWYAWWPTLRLWGGVFLLMGVGMVCLGLIVHPQWSSRELLPYPLVQFVGEMVRRGDKGGLPAVATSRAFWVMFLAMVLLHAMNGLSVFTNGAWPALPLTLDFTQLKQLFPRAAQVAEIRHIFDPTIYPTAVAFAYFLRSEVSVSVGVAPYLWIAMGAVMIGQGEPLTNTWSDASMGAMLRAGASLGFLGMVIYFGRRYYLNVAAQAVGLGRSATETPGYAVWAARGLAVCMVGSCGLLVLDAGLSWLMASLVVLLIVVIMVVLARVHAEAGVIMLVPGWSVYALLSVLFGVKGLGVEAALTLLLVGSVLLPDPREPLMPLVVDGLRMGEGVGRVRPGRLAWPLACMVVIGFVVAAVATLTIAYNTGTTPASRWPRISQPSIPFWRITPSISELSARGELADATGAGSSLDQIRRIAPDTTLLPWLGAGLVLVLGCAWARLRVPWWPLHPVAFLLWGTYAGAVFAFSFLLGAILKWVVMKIGGTRTYHAVKPAMAGVVAGELMATLIWMAVGIGWHAVTGSIPPQFRIWPI